MEYGGCGTMNGEQGRGKTVGGGSGNVPFAGTGIQVVTTPGPVSRVVESMWGPTTGDTEGKPGGGSGAAFAGDVKMPEARDISSNTSRSRSFCSFRTAMRTSSRTPSTSGRHEESSFAAASRVATLSLRSSLMWASSEAMRLSTAAACGSTGADSKSARRLRIAADEAECDASSASRRESTVATRSR